jgi:hypothetical protein
MRDCMNQENKPGCLGLGVLTLEVVVGLGVITELNSEVALAGLVAVGVLELMRRMIWEGGKRSQIDL